MYYLMSDHAAQGARIILFAIQEDAVASDVRLVYDHVLEIRNAVGERLVGLVTQQRVYTKTVGQIDPPWSVCLIDRRASKPGLSAVEHAGQLRPDRLA